MAGQAPDVRETLWGLFEPDRSAPVERGLPRHIADRLATAIIEGRLEPGARLTEPDLAAAFGTSRTPIREALRLLERDSLATLVPRKGARVSVIDAARVAEIYVCRAYLYGLAAKLAVRQATDVDREELERLVEGMRDGVTRGDLRRVYHLNVAFHDSVTQLADNGMLLRMIEQLGWVTLRLRFLSLTLDGRMEQSLAWHERLIEAFQRSDAAGAEVIVRSLVRDAGFALLRHHYDDVAGAANLAALLTAP